MNQERFVTIVELRAERALQEGRFEDARVAILESFDTQALNGVVQASTVDLMSRYFAAADEAELAADKQVLCSCGEDEDDLFYQSHGCCQTCAFL